MKSNPKVKSILPVAANLTSHIRRAAYGHPLDNFTRTADIWTIVLRNKLKPGARISAEEMGLCMIALKLDREVTAHSWDNLVDIAGYSETVNIARQERVRRDQSVRAQRFNGRKVR